MVLRLAQVKVAATDVETLLTRRDMQTGILVTAQTLRPHRLAPEFRTDLGA
jgi:hypothetical protein